mmetsp:Transcript_6031/g.17260  ORF Transcript_6031/g.17260 Transcript_6031/m.17260 type:complete len:316 (-) Transcript_6031:1457-2404(-)
MSAAKSVTYGPSALTSSPAPGSGEANLSVRRLGLSSVLKHQGPHPVQHQHQHQDRELHLHQQQHQHLGVGVHQRIPFPLRQTCRRGCHHRSSRRLALISGLLTRATASLPRRQHLGRVASLPMRPLLSASGPRSRRPGTAAHPKWAPGPHPAAHSRAAGTAADLPQGRPSRTAGTAAAQGLGGKTMQDWTAGTTSRSSWSLTSSPPWGGLPRHSAHLPRMLLTWPAATVKVTWRLRCLPMIHLPLAMTRMTSWACLRTWGFQITSRGGTSRKPNINELSRQAESSRVPPRRARVSCQVPARSLGCPMRRGSTTAS